MSQPRRQQESADRGSGKQTDNRILFHRHNNANSENQASERLMMKLYQHLQRRISHVNHQPENSQSTENQPIKLTKINPQH